MNYSSFTKEELILLIQEYEKGGNKSIEESRDLFLSNISHDVRTLLNVIYGNTQVLINDKNLNKEQRKYIEKILNSSSHLIDLINSVITISKTGKEKTVLSEFNLLELLENLYSIFKNEATLKNLSFVLETSIGDDFFIKSDKSKLFYILLNLLGNAIKYTNEGKVTLKCSINEENLIVFEIIDTGIGIEESKSNEILKKYVRGNNVNEVEGFGLGLEIVSRNLSLLGSKLHIKSKLNEGSHFYFTLDSKIKSKSFISTKDELFDIKEIAFIKDAKDFYIFIYTNNNEEIQILDKYFKSRKIKYRVIKTIKELKELSKLKEHIVFIDFNILSKEEFDFLKACKKNRNNTTFIALTSSIMSEDLVKINEISSTYITEPYSFIDIDQVLIMFSKQEFVFVSKEKEESKKQDIIVEKTICKKLIEASKLGDYKSCLNLIKTIEDKNTQNILTLYLENYDFDEITNILKEY